jgi:RNA polymerase sigma factor (sigma-70 family)
MDLHGVHGADDILAEVALVACQKAVRSGAALPAAESSLVAWLMRSVLFVALNRYRKNKTERRAKAEYESLLHEHELRSVLEERPHWLWPEVQAFLATLDSAERELLELSLRDGLTSAEIGQLQGAEPATVRMRKARLLSRLHARLTR